MGEILTMLRREVSRGRAPRLAFSMQNEIILQGKVSCFPLCPRYPPPPPVCKSPFQRRGCWAGDAAPAPASNYREGVVAAGQAPCAISRIFLGETSQALVPALMGKQQLVGLITAGGPGGHPDHPKHCILCKGVASQGCCSIPAPWFS